MPTFAEFYRAINGRDPFPWQTRLAEEVAATGVWPAEVGVPTGLGKTACLDVAVWWLASQADRAPATRTAPTRIWWVVNRRLLVDSTAVHAEDIATRLSDPESAEPAASERDIVAAVAHRLRSLSADPAAAPLEVIPPEATPLRMASARARRSGCRPLEVIRLRGGIGSRTPIDPAHPAVLLCTLPMYGSRLLFRGYGSSRRLRPVDAAMAGTDSLVLLDEAHLAPHLTALLPALAECMPGARAILGEARSRTRVAALTATGKSPACQRFDLDDQDEAHPVVQQRLDAAKPLALRMETGDSAKCLADATLDLIGAAPAAAACVVFANTPKTAREALDRLRKQIAVEAAELLLLTGLSREREAERIRARILDPVDGMAATRDPKASRRRHLIVVATQTLEVGADIDAEYLVTEACGVRALTQRLGRLNRLGRHAHARAAYVHLPPPKPRRSGRTAGQDSDTWPVYGSEPASVLERLRDACGDGGTGTVNLSPRRVAGILGPPGEVCDRAPEILPGILWEWTKTTTPPDDEAPVEPYFSGIAGAQYTISLIWRVHVQEDGERLWPRATDREAIDVPIGEVRDVLGDEDVRRLASDGVTVEAAAGTDLRPGDQIVLPTDRGLLDAFGWNPAASGPVVDASLVGHGLPLDAKAIERLCGVALGGLIDAARGIAADGEDVDQAERDEAAKEVLARVRAAPAPPGWDETEWRGFVDTLRPQVVEVRREAPRFRAATPANEPQSGDFDETSLGAAAIELDQHGQAVGARAGAIANHIGLPSDLTAVVEYAGRLHDIGKADRRFQRWLDPEGVQGVLVAKSNALRYRWEEMRVAAGWPLGGRHEDLSARLVRAWLEQAAWGDPLQRDLLLHLVISHHGKGRPLVPPVSDGTPETVTGTVEGASVEAPADLGVVDWDQPARFRRLNDRFGPWGLALLEAIVIRADHAVSAGAFGAPEKPR